MRRTTIGLVALLLAASCADDGTSPRSTAGESPATTQSPTTTVSAEDTVEILFGPEYVAASLTVYFTPLATEDQIAAAKAMISEIAPGVDISSPQGLAFPPNSGAAVEADAHLSQCASSRTTKIHVHFGGPQPDLATTLAASLHQLAGVAGSTIPGGTNEFSPFSAAGPESEEDIIACDQATISILLAPDTAADRVEQLTTKVAAVEGITAVGVEWESDLEVTDAFCDGPVFRDIVAFMSTPGTAVSDSVVAALQDEPEIEGFLGWYTSPSLDPILAWENTRFTTAGDQACS